MSLFSGTPVIHTEWTPRVFVCVFQFEPLQVGWGVWKLDEAGRWGPGYAGDMQVCGTTWREEEGLGLGLGRLGSRPPKGHPALRILSQGSRRSKGDVSSGVAVTWVAASPGDESWAMSHVVPPQKCAAWSTVGMTQKRCPM